MGLDISAASNVLKVHYAGPVREYLNKATVLLSQIGRETQDVQGKNFTTPIHYGRNALAGIGYAEGDTLGTPGQQAYATAIIPNAHLYARIQVSGQVMAATKSNAGSFIRALDSELKGATNDMKKAFNRQLHGDGFDKLAVWTTADDTSGTVVDDGNGFAFTHLPNGGTMTCDLIDTDGSTERGADLVVTLGAEAATGYNVTWTGTVSGSADGDFLIPANTLGKQLMGIEGIISDGDPLVLGVGGLHGLPVATNPWFKAQVVGDDTATHVDLKFSLIQKLLSKITQNSDYEEKDVKFLLSSFEMRDTYVDLCRNERQFVNTMKFDGGFEAVEYNGKPLVPDNQCKHGRIYAIVPESLKIFRTSDFEWMEKDGAVLHRLENVDAYRATLFHYGNLATVCRNANGVLKGLNEL